MPAIRIALAAALLAACGSSRPADSSAAADERDQPADAGVSLGRPSQPGDDAGAPELPPTVVKSSVLESQRLTGNRLIAPDPDDQPSLATGQRKGSVAVKFCVDGSGHVSTVKVLKNSASSRYADKVVREIKTWTFRPVVVEGQTVDVCTIMVLLYAPLATPTTTTPPTTTP